MAGEPEREARVQREREGIAIDDQTWAEIVAAGQKMGLSLRAGLAERPGRAAVQ